MRRRTKTLSKMIDRGDRDTCQLPPVTTGLIAVIAVGIDPGAKHLDGPIIVANSRVQNPNLVIQIIELELLGDHFCGNARGIYGNRFSTESRTSQTEDAKTGTDVKQKHSGAAVRDKLTKFCSLFGVADLGRLYGSVDKWVAQQTLPGRNL